MTGAGKGGSDARAPFLDRLVARNDLAAEGMPMWPALFGIPAILFPQLIAIVDAKWFAALAVIISLTLLLWLGFWWARYVYGRAHPYASPRWLRAVRGVLGDQVMAGLLAGLGRDHAREPGHVLTRREVVDAAARQRRRARDAAERARGVRLNAAGPAA